MMWWPFNPKKSPEPAPQQDVPCVDADEFLRAITPDAEAEARRQAAEDKAVAEFMASIDPTRHRLPATRRPSIFAPPDPDRFPH
jgi:hypothetical protein